jgi:hypothetical protein
MSMDSLNDCNLATYPHRLVATIVAGLPKLSPPSECVLFLTVRVWPNSAPVSAATLCRD